MDTGDDLRAAVTLGVGPRTARLSAAVTGRYAAVMQATAYTYDSETRSGSVLLDDGTPVDFDAKAFDAGACGCCVPGSGCVSRGTARERRCASPW